MYFKCRPTRLLDPSMFLFVNVYAWFFLMLFCLCCSIQMFLKTGVLRFMIPMKFEQYFGFSWSKSVIAQSSQKKRIPYLNLSVWIFGSNGVLLCVRLTAAPCPLADDLVSEREKSKLLQEEMEATLHDIQNMWTPRPNPLPTFSPARPIHLAICHRALSQH